MFPGPIKELGKLLHPNDLLAQAHTHSWSKTGYTERVSRLLLEPLIHSNICVCLGVQTRNLARAFWNVVDLHVSDVLFRVSTNTTNHVNAIEKFLWPLGAVLVKNIFLNLGKHEFFFAHVITQ